MLFAIYWHILIFNSLLSVLQISEKAGRKKTERKILDIGMLSIWPAPKRMCECQKWNRNRKRGTCPSGAGKLYEKKKDKKFISHNRDFASLIKAKQILIKIR